MRNTRELRDPNPSSRATGMPQGSIGPTRRRVLRGTLEQRGFGPQRGACVGVSCDD
jgi:hypothetical protein